MITSSEYRQFTSECTKWAVETGKDEDRVSFLALAKGRSSIFSCSSRGLGRSRRWPLIMLKNERRQDSGEAPSIGSLFLRRLRQRNCYSCCSNEIAWRRSCSSRGSFGNYYPLTKAATECLNAIDPDLGSLTVCQLPFQRSQPHVAQLRRPMSPCPWRSRERPLSPHDACVLYVCSVERHLIGTNDRALYWL